MKNNIFTVLGSSGFIGQHLAKHIEDEGESVYCPTKYSQDIYHKNLGNIIYCIGLTSDFREKPFETIEAHICVLKEILSRCEFDSLTYLSSTRLYSCAENTNESELLKVNPNSLSDLYNISKIMGESLCLNTSKHNTKVLRLSNIVGQRPEPDIFIDQLLEEGYQSGKIILNSAPLSEKDYLYIDDAVSLIFKISKSKHTGIFNIASGENIKNVEILKLIEKHLSFKYQANRNKASDPYNKIDISRIESLFEFKPLKFRDYFPRFLEEYMQRKIKNELS